MEIKEKVIQFRQIQKRLEAELPKNLRPCVDAIDLPSKRAALIVGPRGTGKTTLLLKSCSFEKVLYLSSDHPLVGSSSLWDLAVESFNNAYQGIAIDEVHFVSDWSQQLKAIYDSYPQKKIWASDSSRLVLHKGIADLSRRFPKFEIPLLSFREFLQLSRDHYLPVFNPLSENNWESKLKFDFSVMEAFKEYLNHGLRPFFLEGDYQEKIVNIIEKTIYSDIPFLLPSVKDNHLRLMKAVLGYLAESSIPTLNIDSLAREWSLSKEKLYSLLSAMEHVRLITIVRFKSDNKAQGKGAKIFLTDPSLYSILGGNKGNLRESFVVSMAKFAGYDVFACKDERKGDFVIDDLIIEVGGKSKKQKEADFVVRDDIEFASGNVIPLWSLGFLY